MFDRIKKLKLVKQLKDNVSPRLRWLSFSNKNKLDKSTTDYLEAISGVDNLKSLSDEQELEAMVRAQLKEEFPNIESMKSYELLVDAVMHNIKKKQLQATDNLEYPSRVLFFLLFLLNSKCRRRLWQQLLEFL